MQDQARGPVRSLEVEPISAVTELPPIAAPERALGERLISAETSAPPLPLVDAVAFRVDLGVPEPESSGAPAERGEPHR